jgi:hypothetical protein
MIGLALLSTSAVAETPFPTIHEPSDKSLKCIQPEDEMRRNHMNYILHERDETMHEGVRDELNQTKMVRLPEPIPMSISVLHVTHMRLYRLIASNVMLTVHRNSLIVTHLQKRTKARL